MQTATLGYTATHQRGGTSRDTSGSHIHLCWDLPYQAAGPYNLSTTRHHDRPCLILPYLQAYLSNLWGRVWQLTGPGASMLTGTLALSGFAIAKGPTQPMGAPPSHIAPWAEGSMLLGPQDTFCIMATSPRLGHKADIVHNRNKNRELGKMRGQRNVLQMKEQELSELEFQNPRTKWTGDKQAIYLTMNSNLGEEWMNTLRNLARS